jgi:hypothetical protein
MVLAELSFFGVGDPLGAPSSGTEDRLGSKLTTNYDKAVWLFREKLGI